MTPEDLSAYRQIQLMSDYLVELCLDDYTVSALTDKLIYGIEVDEYPMGRIRDLCYEPK